MVAWHEHRATENEGKVNGCDVGTPPSDTGLVHAAKAGIVALR